MQIHDTGYRIRTRYRRRQPLNRHADSAATLTPASCAPHRRRRPNNVG